MKYFVWIVKEWNAPLISAAKANNLVDLELHEVDMSNVGTQCHQKLRRPEDLLISIFTEGISSILLKSYTRRKPVIVPNKFNAATDT